MTLHGEAFVFGQQPRVEHDRIGDADLADIVQLAGQPEDFSVRSGQADQGGQSSGVLPYALQVERGLGVGLAPLCRQRDAPDRFRPGRRLREVLGGEASRSSETTSDDRGRDCQFRRRGRARSR